MLTNLGTNFKDILDGIYKFSWETYDMAPKVKDQLFEVKNMDGMFKRGVDYIVDTSIQLVDGETAGARDSEIMRGYPWFHRIRKIRAQVHLTNDQVKYGPVDPEMIGRKLGDDIVAKEEEIAARIFNEGGKTAGDWIFNNSILGGNDPFVDASGNYIYDEKAFFDTDHPRKIGSTTYNNFTSNALTADAAGITNLQSALTLMEYTNAYDNAGERININSNVLLYSPSLRFTVEEILTTVRGKPYVATNEANVMQGILNPIQWRWLTDADGWFIGQAKKGITWYNQGGLVMEHDYDPLQQIHTVYITKSIGVGVTNWRYWLSNNISAS